ncbi:MAG: gamma-glutamyltransferase [Ignavibacteria bacterium CG_4_8_14_3_um_filter_37_9]|nr:MAG: gamma-glutamyltransferase [Ignavibacteria bacterium CG1_02_37_35]PIS45490.1 MAG: gamma-glutamyltransferase [Ignavibacteria bacterium CG08_land_8_20_14_0_20_37_9]PIW99809.1 MAG: gamma-glutamyltransferase [Ignavibacteria bacterium CG_4_8_14_3_um_filter_37_9]
MLIYFKSTFLLIFLLLITFSLSAKTGHGKRGMVVSAEPIATQVGVQILKKGGNAVDAAVAIGFSLAVTYPVAGNLGGGGYMVIHLPDGRNTAIDYRETAASLAQRDMYLDKNGVFLPELSQVGILSAGIPGSVAGLLSALEKYGTMKIADVLQPAINLAEDGFPLSFSNAKSLEKTLKDFEKFTSSLKVFSKNGTAYQEGDIFKQPELAKTLVEIKNLGKNGFYKGKVAELLLSQMKALGGNFSKEDLENYKPVEREVIKGKYRGFEIVSMPPSSSGGIALVQMLNILENFSFEKDEWNSSKYIHALVSTMKFAYADRSMHLGDPDYSTIPQKWLLSKSYAKKLFSQISDKAISSENIKPGNKNEFNESEETTHYSVMDKNGCAVSVTTTINSAYGSKLVVEGAGFLLNNEMDDFSGKPGVPNQFGLIGSVANEIQPGKRMLSSMTPTIVLKDGIPILLIGSPGGSTIITTVLQVILNVCDFDMNLEQAVNSPRIHHQWLPDELYFELFGIAKDVQINLLAKGYKFGKERNLGLVEAIKFDPKSGELTGVSDKRGFGLAEGF